MVFVQFPPSNVVDTPIIQLRDFAKTDTLLPAGGSQTMSFDILGKDISVWDVTMQNWVVPGGSEEGYLF
jgi:beta-glucosidase